MHGRTSKLERMPDQWHGHSLIKKDLKRTNQGLVSASHPIEYLETFVKYAFRKEGVFKLRNSKDHPFDLHLVKSRCISDLKESMSGRIARVVDTIIECAKSKMPSDLLKTESFVHFVKLDKPEGAEHPADIVGNVESNNIIFKIQTFTPSELNGILHFIEETLKERDPRGAHIRSIPVVCLKKDKM